MTAAVVLLVAAAALQGWLWRLDAGLYDVSLGLRGRPAAADIVIVGIDDASLARIGRWPWRRSLHGSLIERLTAAGARAVASDLILTEADGRNPGDDAALARAMAANGRVLLPLLYETRQGERAEVLPLPALARAAAGFGHIARLTDGDGIVRRAELWQHAGGVARPHLAVALLGLIDPERYRRIGTAGAPILIPYAGPPGHYRHHSYADVLLGQVPAAELQGKVVFIGATATGLSDNFPTPVSGGHFDMPGIEIHATLFDALRRDIRLDSASPAATAVASGLSLLLLLIALRLSSPHVGLLLSACHALLWLGLPLVLLVAGNTWLPPAAALLGSLVAYPLWSWRRLATAQAYMAREIGELGREPGVVAAPARPPATGSDPFVRQIEDIQGAIDHLRSARRFVQDVIDGLPVGVVVSDARQEVVLANSQVAPLLGPTAGEGVVGASLAGLLADLRWPAGFALAPALAGETPLQVQAETGIGRHILLCLAPCRFGTAGGHLLTLDDTTDLRRAQLARDEALQFLSHDLRSPLASILTLLEGGSGAAGPRIAAHARNALAMADDFTQLARAEALDPRRFTDLDLVALVDEAIDDAWAAAREKAIVLTRDIDADEAMVCGERSLLRRAVFNLLDNAIRYSPAGRPVAVHLSRTGGEWRLAVSDQGYGIAAEDLPRLFTRFLRLSLPGQPATTGSGLGLAMVKATIEGHGGRVEVVSAAGLGSSFAIFLPGAD